MFTVSEREKEDFKTLNSSGNANDKPVLPTGTINNSAIVTKHEVPTGNNLLFAALLEHICAHHEPDPEKQEELFSGRFLFIDV